MLKSDRLVCEKNATIAQPVTNYNLDPSILIVKKLPIVRGKIYNKMMLPTFSSNEEAINQLLSTFIS